MNAVAVTPTATPPTSSGDSHRILVGQDAAESQQSFSQSMASSQQHSFKATAEDRAATPSSSPSPGTTDKSAEDSHTTFLPGVSLTPFTGNGFHRAMHQVAFGQEMSGQETVAVTEQIDGDDRSGDAVAGLATVLHRDTAPTDDKDPTQAQQDTTVTSQPTTATAEVDAALVVSGTIVTETYRSLLGNNNVLSQPMALNGAAVDATAQPSSSDATSMALSSVLVGDNGTQMTTTSVTEGQLSRGLTKDMLLSPTMPQQQDPSATVSLKTADAEWAPIRLTTTATNNPASASPHSATTNSWNNELMNALGDRLTLQINQQVKQAHVRLDPPDLGRVDMTVRIEGDKLSVQLQASHPVVRDVLTHHAERLRADLSTQQGQQVDVSVSDQRQSSQHRPQPSIVPADESILASSASSSVNEETAIHSEQGWVSTLA